MLFAVAGCILRWIGGTNIATIGIGLGMMMFGIMPVSVYFPLLMADCIEYGEWKTGKRVEGILAVLPNFANKVAAGLSVSVAGFIMGAAGYDGALKVQSDSAMKAIDIGFNAGPTILLGLMTLLLIVFYDLGSRMPQIRKDLEERRATAAGQEMPV